MPEKPEAAKTGNPETSGEAKAETPSCSSGLLEEEEVSELLDMALCADDLVPDVRVWHSEICSFFQRGNSQEKKANALKLIYGELDEDYTIQDGGYQVHIFGQSEYPGADIQVTGFEHTSHPDQFFDVVIGNIPFNSIKVDDPRYNRYNFRIHDYFLAKSLDKTRPGGIVAVITSKYTMDKANSGSRRYLAQRAELLGASLPNNAFKQVAGTEATTDILLLKKREREIVPDETNSPWLSVEQNAEGIPMSAVMKSFS